MAVWWLSTNQAFDPLFFFQRVTGRIFPTSSQKITLICELDIGQGSKKIVLPIVDFLYNIH